MNKEQTMDAFERFTEKNDFVLNPDREHVEAVIEGIIASKKKSGLKLCPCRLSDGTRESDLELICPCNFKIQDTWKTDGRCWCGLFVKR